MNKKKLEKMAGMAFTNGLKIHYDSMLLFENQSYSTAFSLSVIAIEEIGKAFLIEHQWWHTLTEHQITPEEEQSWLNLIYNHKTKQVNFVYFLDGPIPTNKLLKEISNGSIEILKQNSLYVGLKKQKNKIIVDGKINNPLKLTREKAQKIITLLNDKLLEFCLLQIKEFGGADADSIAIQLNRTLYKELKSRWPIISYKTKKKLEKIESL